MFKYFLLLFGTGLLLAQKKIDPKLTEVWEPIPEVVTPGEERMPPNDAIILFDGTSLLITLLLSKQFMLLSKLYWVSKKSFPFTYGNSLSKYGHEFLDIQLKR